MTNKGSRLEKINTKVDRYLTDGCGRCDLGGTPKCKVRKWPKEMQQLRRIALDCGLTEDLKWGIPCYTYQKANIVIVAAFNEYCSISFFKGALLKDREGILIKPGENTQGARMVRFTEEREVIRLEPLLRVYIGEAIEVEKAGKKVVFKTKNELALPEELQKKLDESLPLNLAFQKLTPGRQRSYQIYIAQAKQPQTRQSRVEKCLPKILLGKGFHE